MGRARVVGLGLGLAMAISFAAHATLVQRMEIEDLARAAEVVAVVRVESVRAAWDAPLGSIRTHVWLTRESAIAGDVPERIHVSVLGGSVDGVSAVYPAGATFRAGKRFAVFLEPRRGHAGEWLVTGAFQGAFEIEREPETGMDVVVRARARDGVALVANPSSLSLSDAERRVEGSSEVRLYVDELVARVRAVRGAR